MKRIITLLLAVAMLAGVIMLSVACTKDPGVTTTDSGKSTEGTTTKGNAAGTTTTGGAAGTDGTTSSSGATTTNPSGTTTTGGEEPVVEWDGKTKLHGKEDESYIAALRERIHVPIIQAFKVTCPEDVAHAQQSSADYILLDNGSGGTGKTFDWSHLRDITRPYILAGGLGPDNLGLAVSQLAPWGVDLSSGVETDGFKDKNKVLAAVQAVRATL